MRILVVEDEKSLSRVLIKILEKNHYACESVYDGIEALEYLESGNFDVVLLDVMLPKLDGISVLKIMREKQDTTPVLILSAKGEIDDKVDGLDAGANYYLTKPFETRELLATLRAITRSTNATSTKLSFGNITLDRSTFELSSQNKTFRLTNKEFQMMEMLMRYPHQILSINQFQERIWGYDSEVETQVVWVYISYLRKKLNALHANIQIKASRNIGYYLEEK